MKAQDKVLTPVGTGFVFQVDTKFVVVHVNLDTAELEPKYQTFELADLIVLDD